MNGKMSPLTLPPAMAKLNSSGVLKMRATTMEEPARLILSLTCASDSGRIHLHFEFERQSSVDMYTVPIAVGLERSQLAHLRLPDLCQ